MNRLKALNLIDFNAAGQISLLTDWNQHIHIVAIEVKLRNWRSAIRQAQQYLRYADEAFVALPELVVQRLQLNGAIKFFEQAGIGLLSVGTALTIKVPAVPSSMHDWRREFAASRLIAEPTVCPT